MATSETFKTKFNSKEFQLRTTTAYICQCETINGSMKDYYLKVYGINERSILFDVKEYEMVRCNA